MPLVCCLIKQTLASSQSDTWRGPSRPANNYSNHQVTVRTTNWPLGRGKENRKFFVNVLSKMPEDICYNCNIDITLCEIRKIYQTRSKVISKGRLKKEKS